MVADFDDDGKKEKEDEYFSEVTGEEHVQGEDFSKFNDPLADVEMENAEVAPQKTSATKKVGITIVIVIVAIIVSMYLNHKQKMKEAAEMGKTETVPAKVSSNNSTDNNATENQATTQASAPAPAPAKTAAQVATPSKLPAPAPAPAPVSSASTTSAPEADNASLAAAISKSITPGAAPAKTETNLTATTAKTVSPAESVKAEAKPDLKAEVKPELKPEVKPEVKVEPKPEPKSETPVATSAAVTDPNTPKLVGRIDDLNLQTQANQTKISDLSTRLDSIDKSIVDLNKTIGMLEKKLNVPQPAAAKVDQKAAAATLPNNDTVTTKVSDKIKVASEHRMKLRPAQASHRPDVQAPRKAKVKEKKMMQEPRMVQMPYVIKAIVPGRAWIERPLAGVISVMEGDYVPGVGKVVNIDEDSGEITLDTGNVIKYGMDDH